jgi:hypothetical protein
MIVSDNKRQFLLRFYSFVDAAAFFAIAYYPIFEDQLQVGQWLSALFGWRGRR